jgi:flagellar protein FliS
MNSMPRTMQNGIFEYRKVGVQSGVESASPHKLIQMLLDGAIEKVQLARGYMERHEIAKKCETVSWAMAIIDGLRSSLNMKDGGAIAENLDALYDYMLRRLLDANLDNDPAALDEVVKLLNELREGWNGIGKD